MVITAEDLWKYISKCSDLKSSQAFAVIDTKCTTTLSLGVDAQFRDTGAYMPRDIPI